MLTHSVEVRNENLRQLVLSTGYKLRQINGQRHFGPPPNWRGDAPAGTEVFVGRIPRDCYEDELVPVFSKMGLIYEMRILMDTSGVNKGFGFVRYATSSSATRAIKNLHKYEIRPGKRLAVTRSVDNKRLYIGGIPKTLEKKEILEEFQCALSGVVDVIVYPDNSDNNLNRGYAFVEFDCHTSAALARRKLLPGDVEMFGVKLKTDWAEPEPQVDENDMKKVKILFIRNLNQTTTETTLEEMFSKFVKPKGIQRIKKIKDYAFVHFATREDAEIVKDNLNNTQINGSTLNIFWARPVDKYLYQCKKFLNNGCPFYCKCCAELRDEKGDSVIQDSSKQTPDMPSKRGYQWPLKREIKKSKKDSKSISIAVQDNNPTRGNKTSVYDTDSGYDYNASTYDSIDPVSGNITSIGGGLEGQKIYHPLPQIGALQKLENLCRSFYWDPPIYEFEKVVNGFVYHIARVYLNVSKPLFELPTHIGPFYMGFAFASQLEAQVATAEFTFNSLMASLYPEPPNYITYKRNAFNVA